MTHNDVTLISSYNLLKSFGSSASNKIQEIASKKELRVIEGEKVVHF
ncbi:hypothetical protein [Oceanobacillus sp. CF4.6]